MQYMLLIYIDPTAEMPPAPDGPDQFTDWVECSKAMHDAGALVSGDGLAGVEAATSVRRRGGRRLVTDGPFAETKEHLLGFYVIDVDGLDTALDWAARLPNAHYGTVEVRPVGMPSASAEGVA